MINVRTANQLDDLKNLLTIDGNICIAVAYVSADALKLINPSLEEALNKGQRVRLLLDLDSGVTQPEAVFELVELAQKHEQFEVKAFVPHRQEGIFHPKLYIAHSPDDDRVTFLVGSHNLTAAALSRNTEHGLWVECSRTEDLGRQTLGRFENLWNDRRAIALDGRAASLYKERYRKPVSTNRDEETRQQLEKYLRDKSGTAFTWPSENTAFLMGAICARGKLVKDHHTRRIRISLSFKPGGYLCGKIKVRDVEYDASKVLEQIPGRIQEEANKILPRAKISVNRQVIKIDCSDEQHAFDVVLKAYRGKLDNKTFPLPTRISSSNKSIVRNFLRGYAVASGLINDNTLSGGGVSKHYVVWLRPARDNEPMYKSLSKLIEDKNISNQSEVRYSNSQPHHVEIPAEDFKKEIGFGIEWWDDLVNAATEDTPMESYRGT